MNLRRLTRVLPLVLAPLTSGCLCHNATEPVTVVVTTSPLTHGPGSDPTVSLWVRLIGLDEDGHASFAAPAEPSDLQISHRVPNPRGTTFLTLSPRAIAEALVASGEDLRSVESGAILLGESFELDCLGEANGCHGSFEWAGASAHATATVTPADRSPAPLLTLNIDGAITTASGERIPFNGTLPFELFDTTYATGGLSSCD